ncbi:MAG TPA: elongation factor G [Saprospiraceae bacterium]|nr:elongation factor G [Saprospiraceae bacterium]
MSFHTKNVRNVVLLGHSGSGKTTFAECMLYEAGEINRRGKVTDGNTASDYLPIEQEKQNSLLSSLMHVEWKDSKINIIDTPGLDDFVGEVISSLRIAATSLILLDARHGVEVGTELIWDYVQEYQSPAIFVVNHMDNEQADYEMTLEQARERFGPKVLPMQFPVNAGTGFNAIVDALRMVMYVFEDGGGKPEKRAIPEAYIGRAQEMHNALVEAAAENDEELMERFFEEGSLTEEELTEGLRIAMAQQEIFPLFIASAERNMGSGRIMGFINDICPSPAQRQPVKLTNGESLACDPEKETSIFIFKTISEPRVGLVSYFKVYSGKLQAGDELVNATDGSTERFSQLYLANGKDRIPVDELQAGDIGVCLKLKNAHSNNTLNAKGVERTIEPIEFPESRIRVAIAPMDKGKMEKLMKAIHTLEEEDPTLHVEQSAALKQTLLHGQGQLHIDMVKHRIELLHDITMEFERPKISYRETITVPADASYRHKKQSGGSGQFAEVHLRVEPYTEDMPDPDGLNVRHKEVEKLPWGGTLAFYWCIVGGSIDNKYMNAIKKGILQKMEEGPLTESPCQDIRVSIYDGKMHSVDSNDMAFMIATNHAFQEAFMAAKPQLLEPIYHLEVLCSDQVMGDVMSDLQTRRAMIMGVDTVGHYQKIIAHVPQAEMYMYSSSLRSITQGKAKFSRHFLEYQPDLSGVGAK